MHRRQRPPGMRQGVTHRSIGPVKTFPAGMAREVARGDVLPFDIRGIGWIMEA